MTITEKLFKILKDSQIEYVEIDHDKSVTCEQSANNRGRDISIGGKTILFKGKKDFSLFTISAAYGVDSNKVRRILNSNKLRFASNEELRQLCEVEKGALPPIVKGLYSFKHYIDSSVFENDEIAFNAGILTKSIIINIEDYKRLIDAQIVEFRK